MRKPLLIYGAGGLGREILSFIRSLDEWEPIGFIDDTMAPSGNIDGLRVYGDSNAVNALSDPTYLVLAIGDPMIKALVVKRIVNPLVKYPVLIHPAAILQHPASIHIGAGSILTAGVILTTGITVGEHVLINLNTTIGHDTTIGDYTSIMPGVNIGGQVSIEGSVLIGAGASIKNRVTVGQRSKVGMGAAVISDVRSGTTVVGVPAKPL